MTTYYFDEDYDVLVSSIEGETFGCDNHGWADVSKHDSLNEIEFVNDDYSIRIRILLDCLPNVQPKAIRICYEKQGEPSARIDPSLYLDVPPKWWQDKVDGEEPDSENDEESEDEVLKFRNWLDNDDGVPTGNVLHITVGEALSLKPEYEDGKFYKITAFGSKRSQFTVFFNKQFFDSRAVPYVA